MDREKLTRETFELDRDIAFHTFRRLYIEKPEIVAACPDPALREEMLRGFWNQDAEKRYPEFQHNTAGMSTEELDALKTKLTRNLAALRFQQILDEPPGNQQEPIKARDRSREM
jgi:ribosomal protein L29